MQGTPAAAAPRRPHHPRPQAAAGRPSRWPQEEARSLRWKMAQARRLRRVGVAIGPHRGGVRQPTAGRVRAQRGPLGGREGWREQAPSWGVGVRWWQQQPGNGATEWSGLVREDLSGEKVAVRMSPSSTVRDAHNRPIESASPSRARCFCCKMEVNEATEVSSFPPACCAGGVGPSALAKPKSLSPSGGSLGATEVAAITTTVGSGGGSANTRQAPTHINQLASLRAQATSARRTSPLRRGNASTNIHHCSH